MGEGGGFQAYLYHYKSSSGGIGEDFMKYIYAIIKYPVGKGGEGIFLESCCWKIKNSSLYLTP